MYLLLKPKLGRKKKIVPLKRGELVVSIPEDQKVHTRDEPQHNFRQLTDPETTFFASVEDVTPLTESEALFLQAVESYSARTQMYISNTLQLVTTLKEGDIVSVQMEKGVANGKISHIGVYQNKPGIYFGVELLVCTLPVTY